MASFIDNGILSGQDVYRDNMGVGTLRVGKIKNSNGKPFGEVASYVHYTEDFFGEMVAGGLWAESGDTSFSVEPTDTANGITTVTTDTNDNDEVIFRKVTENFIFGTKKMWYQAGVQITEAAANSANIFVGLSDTHGANFMQDDGAGTNTTYTGAGFFKVDGGTVWQFEGAAGATKSTDTDIGAFASGSIAVLEFIYEPYPNGVSGVLTAYLNSVKGGSVTITLSNFATDFMKPIFVVKAGTAAAQAMLIDYINITVER